MGTKAFQHDSLSLSLAVVDLQPRMTHALTREVSSTAAGKPLHDIQLYIKTHTNAALSGKKKERLEEETVCN